MNASDCSSESPLRKLQLAELEILDEVISICETYGLRYFILGGTLLGAIRHGGFIPWDDDVDIALPRADYNQFLEFANECLKKPFRVFSYEKDSECRYSWARVVNPSMSITIHSANKPRTEHAWVDLIPLDGMPSGKLESTIHKLHLSFWWNLNQIVQYDELVDQHRNRSGVGAIAVKLAGAFKWLKAVVDYRTCLRKLNEALCLYDYDDEKNEHAFNYLAAYGFRELFEKKDFGQGSKYSFEGRLVTGPINYHAVLCTIYGCDYMSPPPTRDRNKHNSDIGVDY